MIRLLLIAAAAVIGVWLAHGSGPHEADASHPYGDMRHWHQLMPGKKPYSEVRHMPGRYGLFPYCDHNRTKWDAVLGFWDFIEVDGCGNAEVILDWEGGQYGFCDEPTAAA